MGYTTIGLVGHAGAGKDTAAYGLLNLGYTNMKFARLLKSMIVRLLSAQNVSEQTIHRMIEGDLKGVPTVYLGGQTPRHAMQTLGTEWGRTCLSPNFWVDAAIVGAAGLHRVVFTDTRFPNEGEAIRAAGGVLVRITRPGLKVDLSHESERWIAEMTPDLEVENEHGSAAQFRIAFTDIIAAQLRG